MRTMKVTVGVVAVFSSVSVGSGAASALPTAPGALVVALPSTWTSPYIAASDRTGRIAVVADAGRPDSFVRIDRLTHETAVLPPSLAVNADGRAIISADHRWMDLRTGETSATDNSATASYQLTDDGRTYLVDDGDAANPHGWIVDGPSGRRQVPPNTGRPIAISGNGRFVLVAHCVPGTSEPTCDTVSRWDRTTGASVAIGPFADVDPDVADNGRTAVRRPADGGRLRWYVVRTDGPDIPVERVSQSDFIGFRLAPSGSAALVGGRFTSCCYSARISSIDTGATIPLADFSLLGPDARDGYLATSSGRFSGDGKTWLFLRSVASDAGVHPFRVALTAIAVPGPDPEPRLAPNEVLVVAVVEPGVVPPEAAMLNVTVTAPRAAGFATVWPCDAERPATSNLNFAAGETVANAVLAKVSSSGTVCITSNVAINTIVDLSGSFPDSSAYHPISPRRILDTRHGETDTTGNEPAGSEIVIAVGDAGDPGATPSAVMLNVTVTNPAADGFLTVWPCGEPRPLASTVNFTKGATRPNAVLAKAGTGGRVCAFSNADIDLVADAQGWLSTPSPYAALSPARLLDTRIGGTDSGAQVAAGTVKTVTVAGGTTAAMLNVTVTNPTGDGYLTVWPCDADRPTASTLNFGRGQTVANAALVAVGAGGLVCAASNATIDLVVDLEGTFSVASPFHPTIPSRLLDSRM